MNGVVPIPYWRLLARVNRIQNWRRLKSAVARSRLHAFLMGLFVVGYAWLAYTLFFKGLQFTSSFPGLGPVLIERMMFLLFAFLFLLLLLSNVIISFTNLFRNRETQFLLSLPVPHRCTLEGEGKGSVRTCYFEVPSLWRCSLFCPASWAVGQRWDWRAGLTKSRFELQLWRL